MERHVGIDRVHRLSVRIHIDINGEAIAYEDGLRSRNDRYVHVLGERRQRFSSRRDSSLQAAAHGGPRTSAFCDQPAERHRCH
jgi:hypothetical protein